MTWVDDRVYAAGGAQLPQNWAEFRETSGISAVLHLRAERPAPFNGPLPEAFLWMAATDEEQADPQTRLLAARFIAENLGAGRKVLLHADAGRHRTRWAFVAYQLSAGKSLRRALRQGAERPWMSPYHTDQPTWERFLRLLEETSLSPPMGSRQP